MSEHVTITEVSLRDGLQIEPIIVPTERKLKLATLIRDAGFSDYEIGSFVNPAKVPSMADTPTLAEELSSAGARAHALVFTASGARRAVQHGLKHARLTISASDGHSLANAGAPTDEALARVTDAARVLRDGGVQIEATIATAFVCPFDGDTPLSRVLPLAEALCALDIGVLHLADTIGAATPGDIRRSVGAVQRAVGGEVPLGLHLHDTYGMASANAWEALALGIRRFDAATGGLGGCPFAPGAAGNIAADDLVHMLHREGLHTGVDVDVVARLRELLQRTVGHTLDSALAGVGVAPATLRTFSELP